MKKMLVLTAVAVLAFSGMAMAQLDPDPDGMSVYFDAEGMTYCMDVDSAFPYAGTAYVLVTNPSVSEPSVMGWEARIEVTYEALSAGPMDLLGGTNAGSGDNYQVGNGAAPLPIVGNVCVLATYSFLFFGQTDPHIVFSLAGVPGSLTFPDGAGYAAAVGFPTPCQPFPGIWGECAWINRCECVIGNEDLTWGQVKSLY